jgi:hypothetical protein
MQRERSGPVPATRQVPLLEQLPLQQSLPLAQRPPVDWHGEQRPLILVSQMPLQHGVPAAVQIAPFGRPEQVVVDVEVVLLVEVVVVGVVVEVEVVLLVVVVVVRGLRHLPSLHCNWPQHRPLPPPQRCPRLLQSLSSSASANRAGTSAAMAVPAKSLSALRRLMEPSARALARSSKERLVDSWLTCCPLYPKGGTLLLGHYPRLQLTNEGKYGVLQRLAQLPRIPSLRSSTSENAAPTNF